MQTYKYLSKLCEIILALLSRALRSKTGAAAPSLQPHITLTSPSLDPHHPHHHHHSKTEKMTNRVTRSEARHRRQLSMVIPDPSKPPEDGTCLWYKLRRELRIKVKKLAYARDRDAPMKPIMGVDFLRDEIGFVTTDRRRGKLPKLVSRQHTVYPMVYVVTSRSLHERYAILPSGDGNGNGSSPQPYYSSL